MSADPPGHSALIRRLYEAPSVLITAAGALLRVTFNQRKQRITMFSITPICGPFGLRPPSDSDIPVCSLYPRAADDYRLFFAAQRAVFSDALRTLPARSSLDSWRRDTLDALTRFDLFIDNVLKQTLPLTPKNRVTNLALLFQFFLTVWQTAFVSGDYSLMHPDNLDPFFRHRFLPRFSSFQTIEALQLSLRLLGYYCTSCLRFGTFLAACEQCAPTHSGISPPSSPESKAFRSARTAWAKQQSRPSEPVAGAKPSARTQFFDQLDADFCTATGRARPVLKPTARSLISYVSDQSQIPAHPDVTNY
jgi:hypothetical protein